MSPKSLELNLYIYIYIYTYTCVCVCLFDGSEESIHYGASGFGSTMV